MEEGRAEDGAASVDGWLIEQIHAWGALRLVDSGGGEDGGVKIDGTDGNFGSARLSVAGIADHDGGADAFLVRLALGADLLSFFCVSNAVVGDVKHQRVIGQLLLIEKIEQLPAALIKPLDHCPVF